MKKKQKKITLKSNWLHEILTNSNIFFNDYYEGWFMLFQEICWGLCITFTLCLHKLLHVICNYNFLIPMYFEDYLKLLIMYKHHPSYKLKNGEVTRGDNRREQRGNRRSGKVGKRIRSRRDRAGPGWSDSKLYISEKIKELQYDVVGLSR